MHGTAAPVWTWTHHSDPSVLDFEWYKMLMNEAVKLHLKYWIQNHKHLTFHPTMFYHKIYFRAETTDYFSSMVNMLIIFLKMSENCGKMPVITSHSLRWRKQQMIDILTISSYQFISCQSTNQNTFQLLRLFDFGYHPDDNITLPKIINKHKKIIIMIYILSNTWLKFM